MCEQSRDLGSTAILLDEHPRTLGVFWGIPQTVPENMVTPKMATVGFGGTPKFRANPFPAHDGSGAPDLVFLAESRSAIHFPWQIIQGGLVRVCVIESRHIVEPISPTVWSILKTDPATLSSGQTQPHCSTCCRQVELCRWPVLQWDLTTSYLDRAGSRCFHRFLGYPKNLPMMIYEIYGFCIP
jgi:hypothetical protein